VNDDEMHESEVGVPALWLAFVQVAIFSIFFDHL
jgi:hypothetical protein